MTEKQKLTPSDAPPPFKQSVRRGAFTTHNGPWFHWAQGADFRQGVRIIDRHCNSRGIAHGGFLSALADGLAATAVFRELKRGSVTIKLTTEFLRPVRIGDWLQGTAHITHAARNLAFVEAMAWVGEGVGEGKGVGEGVRIGKDVGEGKTIPENNLAFTSASIFRLFE